MDPPLPGNCRSVDRVKPVKAGNRGIDTARQPQLFLGWISCGAALHRYAFSGDVMERKASASAQHKLSAGKAGRAVKDRRTAQHAGNHARMKPRFAGHQLHDLGGAAHCQCPVPLVSCSCQSGGSAQRPEYSAEAMWKTAGFPLFTSRLLAKRI